MVHCKLEKERQNHVSVQHSLVYSIGICFVILFECSSEKTALSVHNNL